MTLLNPLGLLNGDPSSPVRVQDVASGLACNCFCAKCGARFVAVRSNTKQWYFRHHNAEDCGRSFESAVHLMAKEVLVQNKCLTLPYLEVRPSPHLLKVGTKCEPQERLVNRKLMIFEHVEDEVWMEGRRPDIVMQKGGRKLLVEIFVTHDITQEKLRWIKEHDFPTIRIDLSWVGYEVNRHILEQCLRDGYAVGVTPRFNIVRWVHHPRLAAVQSRVNEEYLRRIGAPPEDDVPF